MKLVVKPLDLSEDLSPYEYRRLGKEPGRIIDALHRLRPHLDAQGVGALVANPVLVDLIAGHHEHRAGGAGQIRILIVLGKSALEDAREV